VQAPAATAQLVSVGRMLVVLTSQKDARQHRLDDDSDRDGDR
jgi:hypothetical protein